MNCPLCIDRVLDATYHGGIEIDVCPNCRGIWLDRGELERLAAPAPVAPPAAPPPVVGGPTGGADRFTDPRGPERSKPPKKRRKKSLAEKLGDVLEEVIDL